MTQLLSDFLLTHADGICLYIKSTSKKIQRLIVLEETIRDLSVVFTQEPEKVSHLLSNTPIIPRSFNFFEVIFLKQVLTQNPIPLLQYLPLIPVVSSRGTKFIIVYIKGSNKAKIKIERRKIKR